MKQPRVYVADCEDQWRPLNNLYYLPTANSLVSQESQNVMEEVISQFCPQCFTVYNSEQASQQLNSCMFCTLCLRCNSILSVVEKSDESYFVCRYCTWISKPQLKASSKSSLLQACNDHFASSCQATQSVFDNLVSALSRMSKKSSENKSEKPLQRQTYDEFEQSVESRTIDSLSAIREFHQSSLSNETYNALLSQTPSSIGLCRVPLSTKRTLRIAEANIPSGATGRSNILVQPKTSPLEGDSSMKLQRGKWFFKDTSAVHEVPSLWIRALDDSDPQSIRVLVDIRNPKEKAYHATLSIHSLTSPLSGTPGHRPQCVVAPHRPTDLWSTVAFVWTAPTSQMFPVNADSSTMDVIASCSFPLGAYEDELLLDEFVEDRPESIAYRYWQQRSSSPATSQAIAIHQKHHVAMLDCCVPRQAAVVLHLSLESTTAGKTVTTVYRYLVDLCADDNIAEKEEVITEKEQQV